MFVQGLQLMIYGLAGVFATLLLTFGLIKLLVLVAKPSAPKKDD